MAQDPVGGVGTSQATSLSNEVGRSNEPSPRFSAISRTAVALTQHQDGFNGGMWEKIKAGAQAVGRGLWSAVKGIATNKVLWGIGLIALAMVCPWTIPAIIVGLAGAALFAYGTYQNTKETYQLAQDLGLGKGWSGLWAGAAALLNIGAAVATVFTFGAAAGLSIKAQAGVHAAVNWMSSKTGANVAHFAGQAAGKDGALALAGAGLIVLPTGAQIVKDAKEAARPPTPDSPYLLMRPSMEERRQKLLANHGGKESSPAPPPQFWGHNGTE